MFPVSDPIIYFGILAAGILLAPVLSSRLRIPDLIILLLFGAILGPNALHVLDRNSAVTLLGSVGKIYIMFLAGLEIDFYRFKKSYKRSIYLGMLTFLIPQVLGTFAGRYLLGMNWISSILLASMFASHTLLTYPQASRLGITQREPVAITVGATIFTDTLALLVLAVIADSAKGMSLDLKLITTILAGMLMLTLLIWKIVPLLSRWFFRTVSEESNTQFLFVIMILCVFAYLSYLAKMEPIIGAFLVGTAFNRLIPERGRLMNRILFTGNTLFIPIFLISVGMLVDIRSMLTGTRSWIVGGVMILAVIISKYLAALTARFTYKYSSAAGNVIFGLSVVQAAATLAAVIVGFELKILSEEVLNGTIMMILATCLLGSWVVEHFGKMMALEKQEKSKKPRTKERLLVMISSLKKGLPLLDMAYLMQSQDKTQKILPYTIISNQGNIDAAIDEGENLLGHCVAHSATADIIVEPGLRVEANVSDGIKYLALELNTSTILLGYPGRGRYFGSVMYDLLEQTRSRLIFCHLPKPVNTIRRLLVPMPSLSCRRKDIRDFVKTCKTISSQTTRLKIMQTADSGCDLQILFNGIGPQAACEFTIYDNWKKLLEGLYNQIKTDDMVLLPLDRRSGIMWTPGLERLAQDIKSRFPKTNLMIDFPSLESRENIIIANDTMITNEDLQFIPVEATNEDNLKDIIELLAREVIPHNTECLENTCKQLNDLINSSPLELSPGILMIHTRNTDLKDQLVIVCHTSNALQITDVAPAKYVIALLSSRKQSPEIHLKNLSNIATAIRQIEKDNALKEINSAEELCDLIPRASR